MGSALYLGVPKYELTLQHDLYSMHYKQVQVWAKRVRVLNRLTHLTCLIFRFGSGLKCLTCLSCLIGLIYGLGWAK